MANPKVDRPLCRAMLNKFRLRRHYSYIEVAAATTVRSTFMAAWLTAGTNPSCNADNASL
jgi:hypothetical protein